MTEQAERRTATIYQFPAKARAARQEGSGRKSTDTVERPTEFGSGWYHDAAIQEAEQVRR
jgi:hypothetical protein